VRLETLPVVDGHHVGQEHVDQDFDLALAVADLALGGLLLEARDVDAVVALGARLESLWPYRKM
jgi:hypothetical protein